jgi:hypothetical protein
MWVRRRQSTFKRLVSPYQHRLYSGHVSAQHIVSRQIIRDFVARMQDTAKPMIFRFELRRSFFNLCLGRITLRPSSSA